MPKKKDQKAKLSSKATDSKKTATSEKTSEPVILSIAPLAETKQSLVRILQLIISALTLVAGLAWNDAVRNFISQAIEPAVRAIFSDTLGDLAGIITPFIYAIIITFMVVFVINRVQKLEQALADKPKE